MRRNIEIRCARIRKSNFPQIEFCVSVKCILRNKEFWIVCVSVICLRFQFRKNQKVAQILRVAQKHERKMNVIFFALFVCAPIVSSLSGGKCPKHDVVTKFNVEKFAGLSFNDLSSSKHLYPDNDLSRAGLWYETHRTADISSEEHLVCATATFTPQADGHLA